ncbi:MAG TPA: hypothetical protein DHU16_03755 [Gammaproteobacteria bacterium]|nr:hypothetical protein [Gammaproteobacteria bacterium]
MFFNFRLLLFSILQRHIFGLSKTHIECAFTIDRRPLIFAVGITHADLTTDAISSDFLLLFARRSLA